MKTPRRVPKPRRKASEKKLQYVSLVCLESNNCFQSSAQKSSNVRLMIMIMRHIINYRNIMKYHCISSTSQYLEQVSFQSHFKTKSHFNHSGFPGGLSWIPFWCTWQPHDGVSPAIFLRSTIGVVHLGKNTDWKA